MSLNSGELDKGNDGERLGPVEEMASLIDSYRKLYIEQEEIERRRAELASRLSTIVWLSEKDGAANFLFNFKQPLRVVEGTPGTGSIIDTKATSFEAERVEPWSNGALLLWNPRENTWLALPPETEFNISPKPN
jgi:hypothetical protein